MMPQVCCCSALLCAGSRLGLYLHGDLPDQVPLVGVVQGDAVGRGAVHHQLPQHGALLPDLLGQLAGVDSCRTQPNNVYMPVETTERKQLAWF